MKTIAMQAVISALIWLILWVRFRARLSFWRAMYREESKYSSYLFDIFTRTNCARLKLLKKTNQTINNEKERPHD